MNIIIFKMKIQSLILTFLQFVSATLLLNLVNAFAQAESSSSFNPDEYLELRGKYRLGGVWRFNLYNKDMQGSKWLKVGQRTGNFKIQSYDPESEKLTIDMDGATGVIGLAKAKEPSGSSTVASVGGSSISATNLRFKNGLYYELGKEDSPFTGSATKKYPTGKPWYERSYKGGKKHGPTVEWFPNGQKKYEMFYTENQRTGVWTYWNQEGKITAKRQYEKNQFVKNLPLK